MTNETENLTPAMDRILELAALEARKDKGFIGSDHVLVAMMMEGGNCGCRILQGAGLTLEGLRKIFKP